MYIIQTNKVTNLLVLLMYIIQTDKVTNLLVLNDILFHFCESTFVENKKIKKITRDMNHAYTISIFL